MFKAFCDGCGEECDIANSNTRRFYSLKRSIGFEVIPLYNKEVCRERHVCNNCVAEALFKAIGYYPKSPTVLDIESINVDASNYRRDKTLIDLNLQNINKERKEVLTLLNEVKQMVEVAKKLADEIKDFPALEKERIRVLQAQTEALQAREATKKRIEEGTKIQEQVDKEEYPEYINRVDKRARIRMS